MKKYESPKLEELKFNIVSGFCNTDSKSNIIDEEIGDEVLNGNSDENFGEFNDLI